MPRTISWFAFLGALTWMSSSGLGDELPKGTTYMIGRITTGGDASAEAVMVSGKLPGPGRLVLRVMSYGSAEVARSIETPSFPDGSFAVVWDERDAMGRWMGRDPVRYNLACTGLDGQPGPLVTSMSVVYPTLNGNRAQASVGLTLLRDAALEFWLEKQGCGSAWRVLEVPRSIDGGLGGRTVIGVPMLEQGGNALPPGRYRLTLLARVDGQSDKRQAELVIEATDTQAALAGGAGSWVPPGGASVAQGGGGAPSTNGASPGDATGHSPSSATSPGSEVPHDNGWHNGSNPNGVSVQHDDKSRGNGNNHH